ncbi:MAG: MBL fold metallo-hydrolase [Pirellulales bacterium]|nr:MBL fold metallo-hydrolase [Pirellulales bacterium]
MSVSLQSTPQISPPVTLRVGKWRVDVLDGGRFQMDGGVLFGVVPRRLWQMARTPDALNRLPCACNCLLLRDGHRTVLIDTGYGGKASPLDRKFYAMTAGNPLMASLQAVDVDPADIDTVLLTHLHWDHAGGASHRDESGRVAPSFPQARHVIGRLEWEDANSAADELGGAYSQENLAPLRDQVELALIEDQDEIVAGLTAHVTGGHTRGHLALVLESQGETGLCLTDLCPSTYHLRRLWSLAYDLYPLDTRREKPRWLGRAADGNWVVFWSHDPRYAATRLTRDAKREFAIGEAWTTG